MRGPFRLGRLGAYGVVCAGLGLLLLAAAAAKGHQLATQPVAELGLLTSRWFLVAVVEFELAFGLWLLMGLYPRWTWRVALLCFVGFAGVSLQKALSGETSCGCFGAVEVDPRLTFLLDVTAAALLLWFQPVQRPGEGHRVSVVRLRAYLAITLLVAPSAGVVMLAYRPTVLSGDAAELAGASLVVLRPERWVGDRFPLLGHIDIGQQFASGKWVVVFYHGDCPDCRRLLLEYKRSVVGGRKPRGGHRVAFVWVRDLGGTAAQRPLRSDGSYVVGSLSDSKDWFISTPAIVCLNDAIVAWAADDREDIGVSMLIDAVASRQSSGGKPGHASAESVLAAVGGKGRLPMGRHFK